MKDKMCQVHTNHFKIEKTMNFFFIYTCILTGAHRSTFSIFSIFDIITRTTVRGFGVFKKNPGRITKINQQGFRK